MGGQTAEIWLDSDNGLAMTACCLLAPAMDWARLGMMMKDRGQVNARQVISAEWIDAMLTPSPLSDRYGYFTWLGNDWETYRDHFSETEHTQSEPFMVDDIFMFLGRGGQRVFVSRQHDLIIVRLGPHTTMNPLKKGWDNAFLINTIIRAIERDSCLTGFC
jgi:CubicO group peptidase (beta-lactamase class C family)